MTIEKEQILEALQTLDTENDEHWTNQGLPAVAALGIDDLKRKDITEAAPHFTRENPAFEPKEDDENDGGDEDANEGDNNAPSEDPTDDDILGGDGTEDTDLGDRDVLVKNVEKAQEAVHTANAKLTAAIEELDDFDILNGSDRVRKTTQEDIQAFLKSQLEQRIKNANKGK